MKLEVAFEKIDDKIPFPCAVRRRISIMRQNQVAVVALPRATEIGVIRSSQIQLHETRR